MSTPAGAGLAALAAGVAVTAGVVAGVLVWERAAERRERRLIAGQLTRLVSEPFGTPAAEAAGVLRDDLHRRDGALAALVDRVSHLRSVELLLDQADVGWRVSLYLWLSTAGALALGAVGLLASGGAAIALTAAAGGAMLPYLHLRRCRSRRMAILEEQLPEALDLLARALRAGHPVTAGLRMVAEDTPQPIAGEFQRLYEGQRYGSGFADALRELTRRAPMPDMHIFAMALTIQQEIGGNLLEILDKLSQIIRQRFAVRRQLRTYTAQGRLSGYVLGGLPVVLGLVLLLIAPEDMRAFASSPLGRTGLSAAAMMQVAGFVWIRRITRVDI